METLTEDEQKLFCYDIVLPIYANKREKLEENEYLSNYKIEEFEVVTNV